MRPAVVLAIVLLLCGCATTGTPPATSPTPSGDASPTPATAPATTTLTPSTPATPPASTPSTPTPASPTPACAPDPLAPFTHAFVDASQVAFITPLGGLNVGSEGRTYVHVVPGNGTERNLIPLTMPADGTLKRLAYALRGYPAPDARAQWRLEFDLSCNVTLVFDHVQDVVPAIQRVSPAEPATATNVVTSVDVPFRAGDLIGHPNGTSNAGGFDFYLLNWSYVAPHANLSRWSAEHQVHAICPYDAFEPTLRATYYALFASQGGTRMTTPTCRSVVTDVEGTLAGAWFVGDATMGGGERVEVGADSDASVNLQLDHADGQREALRLYPPVTDPANVTVGQDACWAPTNGANAVWMKLVSPTRMLLARPTSCGGAFPEASAIAYDR